jgi:hypothetical protein
VSPDFILFLGIPGFQHSSPPASTERGLILRRNTRWGAYWNVDLIAHHGFWDVRADKPSTLFSLGFIYRCCEVRVFTSIIPLINNKFNAGKFGNGCTHKAQRQV